jgi:alkaline phosphatase D
LRFAVVCCASYAAGFFQAYRAVAERQDLDAVLHLGDYIYEHGTGEYGSVRTYEPGHELLTLEDYRRRYAQYRADPDLQELHRQLPMLAIWDDHEVANNAWRDGAENHQPDEGDYADRKRAAIQAYFEWLPLREVEAGRVYRSFRYGDLLELILADTRHWGRDELIDDLTDPGFQDPARSILGEDQERWLEQELVEATTTWRVLAQQGQCGRCPRAQ